MINKRYNKKIFFIHLAWGFLFFALNRIFPTFLNYNSLRSSIILFISCALLGHIAIALWGKGTAKEWQVSFFMVLIGILFLLVKMKGSI